MKKDIQPLTGLRAVEALLVVAYHFREAGAVPGTVFFDFGWLDPIISRGYLGVDLFFILSGFIITHVYRDWFAKSVRPRDCLTFLRYRIARLYPVHAVMLAATVGLYFVAIDFGRRPNGGCSTAPLC